MKLNSLIIVMIVITIIFGGVYLSSVGGLWITESKKEVRVIEEGELSGLPDPEDIRGSYSLGDIENNFGIPSKDIAIAFGIDTKDPKEFKIKDLENMYADLGEQIEIGTESVRIFVSMYNDIPFDWSGDIPSTAVELLKSQSRISDLEEAYLSEHSVNIDMDSMNKLDYNESKSSNYETDSDEIESPTVEEDHIEGENAPMVNGKTTVKDLINYGIAESDIIELIGSYANENMLIRDVCSDNGVAFSEAKNKFTEILESIQ